MDNGSALLNSIADSLWLEQPGPKLLIEFEPAHQVFLSNLLELLLPRHQPPVDLVSLPGPFWRDVFIPSGPLWWSFLESGLWHTIAVLVLLIIYQAWGPPKQFGTPQMERSRIFYYKPDPTFPALGSSPPRTAAQREHKSEAQHALQVPREVIRRPEHQVAPPDIAALTKPKQLPTAVGAKKVAPAMPLSAALGTQRKGPQIGFPVIAPPPEVKQTGTRSSNGLPVAAIPPAPVVAGGLKSRSLRGGGGAQTVVVAPAPEVVALAGRRGIAGPKPGLVAPAPTVQPGSLGRTGKGAGGDLLHVEVIAPAPKLPNEGQGAGGGTTRGGVGGIALGGPGVGVVPPPPSVQGSGSRSGGGAGGSFGSFGTGLSAVPPPPSVEGTGRLTGLAGGGLGGGPRLGAVPPATSVDGAGSVTGLAGRGLGGGSGLAVVPPPPSIGGMGSSTGFGGGHGLGGSGSAVVPPPPSLNGTGGLNGAGAGSLSGSFGSAVAPAPSLEGAGTGGGNGTSLNGSNSLGVAPAPAIEGVAGTNATEGLNLVVEEVPMRIVGLAFALPSTSFSSSYEVFIAEKEIKGHKELIKLVYWFLPYQRRLSEYHPDASRMYKLRVTRDHVCDESLQHMAVSPSGQVYAGSHLAADSLPLNPEKRDVVLPCYRTTADDYRKAAGRH